MRHQIKKTYILPASPHRVFAALTDSKKIQVWSGQAGSVSKKIDGPVSLFDGWNKGIVCKFEPGETLSYTWLVDGWDEAKPSVVFFKLTPVKTGTRVVLTHTDLPSAKEAKDHASGWDEYFFDPLQKYLEDKALPLDKEAGV